MRILVITSCTGLKKHKPPNQLKYEDFASPERLCQRTAELKDFKVSAAEMYTGQQHRHLMEGLKQLREIYGQKVVDLNIISAGYGLLGEKDIIVPYNVTFQGLKKKEILDRSHKLQIHKHVETSIADYDLVFFLLGQKYVQALKLPFQIADSIIQIFLLGDTHKRMILKHNLPSIHFVPAGECLRHELHTNFTALKGIVFKKLCEEACRKGFEVFEKVKENPEWILEIVE